MSDMRATVVAATCLMRRLPLFFRSTPKTPLRVLGIVALDTLHVLRTSRPLPKPRVDRVAAMLDFLAYANAAWDHKDLSHAEYQAFQRQLESRGLGACVRDYLNRLRTLESWRPPIGGDARNFEDVREYRDAVARLSLATAAAVAFNRNEIETSLRATHDDPDVNTLVRILLLCQIVDDVMDYAEDRAAGLPSFVTACRSRSEALQLTAGAVRTYGRPPAADVRPPVLPFRWTLFWFTAITTVVVRVARFRHGRTRPSREAVVER